MLNRIQLRVSRPSSNSKSCQLPLNPVGADAHQLVFPGARPSWWWRRLKEGFPEIRKVWLIGRDEDAAPLLNTLQEGGQGSEAVAVFLSKKLSLIRCLWCEPHIISRGRRIKLESRRPARARPVFVRLYLQTASFNCSSWREARVDGKQNTWIIPATKDVPSHRCEGGRDG
jgi:hypothetical protein